MNMDAWVHLFINFFIFTIREGTLGKQIDESPKLSVPAPVAWKQGQKSKHH